MSAGHAPGVIPGVPVLTEAQALFIEQAADFAADGMVRIPSRGQRPMAYRLRSQGLLKLQRAIAEDNYEAQDDHGRYYVNGYEPTEEGRAALAAHRLGLATRYSTTIDTIPALPVVSSEA